MKITQKVRGFAAKQNSGSYLADAEAGMEKMSEVYQENGEALCVTEG